MEEAPNKETPEIEKVPKSKSWSIKEFLIFIFITLIIVLPIRIFIAQPFIVSGASMDPTFENGQYIIVDQISYDTFNNPERGDVIIFRFPQDPSKFFIKRIIALPNETIKISEGEIFIKEIGQENFRGLQEDFLEMEFETSIKEMTLGEDEFFVLGDNRNNSVDSRYFGAIQKDAIIGRAFLRLFPVTEIDYLPGKFEI